jgi:hypothetical protein
VSFFEGARGANRAKNTMQNRKKEKFYAPDFTPPELLVNHSKLVRAEHQVLLWADSSAD